MPDVIERAARAICISCGAPPDDPILVSARLPERVTIPRWQSVTQDARAALQAALDPTDEALVERIARAMRDARVDSIPDPRDAQWMKEQPLPSTDYLCARAALLALRSACSVPNESPPSGDTAP